jgi:5-carboxymethyl-2-hydroxymuconate isomerase
MPHIIIEHDKETKDKADLSKLSSALHQTLSEQETIKLESIKTRTIEIDNVLVADGSNNKMLHVEVRLLSGRSVELKETMANAVYNEAQKYLEGIECMLTVNISELGVYKK